jgi:hypothetical protein
MSQMERVASGNSTAQLIDDRRPTAQAYTEFQEAYDHFNAALFGGTLPACLITFQRRAPNVFGYYHRARFGSNQEPGATTDEIAMNPIHFKGRDVTGVLQTLVHEMCHLWQCHFGKPSRSGYHNREWAAKMLAIGLHPSSTGKPGGTVVGEHMADYVITGGAFERALQDLTRRDFRITWYDRLAELVAALQDPPWVLPTANAALDTPQRPGSRQKYSCPHCRLNAWAKPRAHLICGECQLRMEPRGRVLAGVSAAQPSLVCARQAPGDSGATSDDRESMWTARGTAETNTTTQRNNAIEGACTQ